MRSLALNSIRPLALLIALSTLLPASAQTWAREQLQESPRHLEWVKVKHGDRVIETFVAYPENPEKATVVVLIHEIFGLSDWARLLADNLAEAGYIAVAPDLLSGMGPNSGGSSSFPDVEATRKAVGDLPQAQVTADLKAVATYAKAIPAGNGKLVLAGFCWGGSQTFHFATQSDQMLAYFPFYGTAPEDKADLAKIDRPIYGFFAQNDARVNATLPPTEAALKDLHKTFEPVIYKDAGHGFMRAGVGPDASPANAQARKDAWKRWLNLMEGL